MGSSNNDAQKEAQKAEAARQAAIAASVGKIDSVFSDPRRQAQYQDFLEASRAAYQDQLGRDQKVNERQLRFANARSGNTGGSVAVDSGRRLSEAFQKGTLEAERLAQGDESNLRQADQDSRLRLISMAQSGLDATTGVRNASEALRSNLQAGGATRNVKSISDIFGQFSDIYKKSQDAANERKGANYAYNTTYQPGLFSGYGGAGRN